MNVPKCNFCNKSVYPNDSHVNLDSHRYHTGCAKCADCKCQITLANFTKSGDLLLCKTHYFERFSTQGSYAGADKFKKTSSANSAPVLPVNVAPVTSSFTRTEEPLSEKAASVKDRLKQFGAGVNDANKCAICSKSVYPNDPQLALDGNKYHKGCAKCADCQCQITTSNFTRDDKILYCKTHYIKRFKEQGKFVGDDKFNRKRGDTNAEHLAGHSSLGPPNPPSGEDEKAKEDEERLKAEEEEAAAKQKAEEEEAAAKQKAEEEEAAAKQKAEEEEAAAKQKADEEEAAAKQKAEEEEAAAKQKAEEEEAAAKQKAEEEEAAAKQKADEEEKVIDESTNQVSDDVPQNDDDEDETV